MIDSFLRGRESVSSEEESNLNLNLSNKLLITIIKKLSRVEHYSQPVSVLISFRTLRLSISSSPYLFLSLSLLSSFPLLSLPFLSLCFCLFINFFLFFSFNLPYTKKQIFSIFVRLSVRRYFSIFVCVSVCGSICVCVCVGLSDCLLYFV